MYGKKKWLIAALAGVIVLGVCLYVFVRPSPRGAAPIGQELLRNGDFASGQDGWETAAWVSTPGYTEYRVLEGEGPEGGNALYIRNTYPNDARFYQQIDVQPSTLYRLRAVVKADAQDGKGANISVEGVYAFSDCVYDTGDEWQEICLYGRTGENQTRLTVFIRLGGYSGESSGEAWFGSASVTAVDSVPEGYSEQRLYSSDAGRKAEDDGTGSAALPMILCAAGYVLIALLLRGWYGKENAEAIAPNGMKNPGRAAALIGLCVLAAVIRLIAAIGVRGYDVDVNDFRIWADRMAAVGPGRFYDSTSFCDYPPGYLLILWAVGGIGKLCGGTTALMVKIPSIVFDVLIMLMLYGEGKRCAGYRRAFSAAALYALSPLAVAAGAAWGQADSVMTAVLLAVVICAFRRDWLKAIPLYTLAVLIKPQALMFGPLGLAALIADGRASFKAGEREKFLRKTMGGIGLLAAVLALVLVPFAGAGNGLEWVIQLYGSTMASYGFVTVNSCNLYFLMNRNWVNVLEVPTWLESLAAGAVLAIPLLAAALVRRKRETVHYLLPLIPLAAMAALRAAGTQWEALNTFAAQGYVLIALAVLLGCGVFLKSGAMKHVPLCGGMMLCLFFTVGTMMHERYLFPAAALFLLAYLYERDRRMLGLAVLCTAACFLNVTCVLDRNIRIGGAAAHLSAPAFGIQSDLGFFEYAASALNVLAAMLSVAVCYDLCILGNLVPEKAAIQKTGSDREALVASVRRARRAMTMDRKDWLIMGCVTMLFAALTFTNLGSLKAPQTGYTFTEQDESAVYDLGESRDFTLLYDSGIHYGDTVFQVEASEDGTNWNAESYAKATAGDCFKWKYVTDAQLGEDGIQYLNAVKTFHGRFVRLTAKDIGLTLFELIARGGDGKSIPMTLYAGAEEAGNLADEPFTLEGEPDWYNSTYFDEIYHARTAYELLHGMNCYEWTHPPLGKVMMSWAVAVFGMTPFGWRFAGALMGVIMLPGMYLLGKLLFRRRIGAVGMISLMALDFMHFTQTRIATIDSFVVCFIIWAYVWMLMWFKTDVWRKPLWKSLVPLLLSGVSMGLSIASKWTGCYAGVGLAILFFWGFFRHLAEARACRTAVKEERHTDMLPEETERGALPGTDSEKQTAVLTAAEQGVRRMMLTALACVGFFVVIPLAIYYASYIPFFAGQGGVTAAKIIQQCQSMLSYHATPRLGMDHFFYSPWYEWPLSIKPMWYASTGYAPEGTSRVIFAFGNPAVWWPGALAMVLLTLVCCWKLSARQRKTILRQGRNDDTPAVILISFLAQYLPWILVPRGTYIYHYFTAVPFMIAADVWLITTLYRHKPRWGWIVLWIRIAAAAALFAAFFPYISGITASTQWLDSMKWFDKWLYY